MEIENCFELKHPSTWLIAGPTGCGKTQFISKLLLCKGMICPHPTRIIWVFMEWQSIYEELKKQNNY